MQPSLGVIVTKYTPVDYEILVDGDYEIISAMLRDYAHNDFRYDAAVANSVFPTGALLGFTEIARGGIQQALDAGSAAVATVSDINLYTWTSVLIANRGINSDQDIPASMSNHVAVLAKDVDLYDQEISSVDYIVPVFWRGTFKPTGIIQDTASYALAPWPMTDGDTTRISIVPGNR